MKYFVAVLVIALGAVGVVVGGIDDSPGFQLLSPWSSPERLRYA